MALSLSCILFDYPGTDVYAAFESVPMVLNIAGYVLTALAFYAMARKRGIRQGWLAWVPVANVWLLGSFSDQYQYVVKGKVKSRRIVLLILSILSAVFTAAILAMGMGSFFEIIRDAFRGLSDQQIQERVMDTVLSVLGMLAVMLPLTIAFQVFRFMALYDVFKSCDPETAVMFLVLSIFFRPVTPFFLFFNREKEKGMPPRKICTDLPGENPAATPAPEGRAPAETAPAEKTPEYL